MQEVGNQISPSWSRKCGLIILNALVTWKGAFSLVQLRKGAYKDAEVSFTQIKNQTDRITTKVSSKRNEMKLSGFCDLQTSQKKRS